MEGISQWTPIILMMLALYFLFILPQSRKAKKEKKFLSSLKNGDLVVTKSGMHGKIIEVNDRKEHCDVVKTYHSESKSDRKEIKLFFPVTVTFYDDDKNLIEKVMDSEKDLQELKETCEQKDTKERKN